VINERPVFEESRRPELVAAESEDAAPEEEAIAVRDPPKVRLTGVIITPALRMAWLTPTEGGEESVRAHEGESLVGDYVGWQLAVVKPRSVVLASRDGQSLELELEVNDQKIKEPTKTATAQKRAQAGAKAPEQGAGDENEPLSRAEQIRQRIAERREELRRQQEEQRAGQTGGGSAYQKAVRSLMRKKSKDNSSDDNEEG
jgi:hypothetical protein